jgi:hypothetical protein
MTEIDKLRWDLYRIVFNFVKLHIQEFENLLQKLLRKKIFRVSKPKRTAFFFKLNVEQVI